MASSRRTKLKPSVGLLSQNDVQIQKTGVALPQNIQYYVLHTDFDGATYSFWFTQGPVHPGSALDKQIDISVFNPTCTICIQLDTDVNWQLQTSQAAVTLGDANAANRYRDLSVPGGAMEALFGATLNAAGTLGDVDPFNIYVVLNSIVNGEAQQSGLRIDPDIKNPGPPQLGGGPKALRKRKGSSKRKNKRTKRR